MGELQPKTFVSRRITGDTQFMFQFYKPCIQYYEPPSPGSGGQQATCMSETKLRRSLITALHGCPLLFGRFKIHPDLTISLDYDPENSNPPTLQFQRLPVTYSQIRAQNFAYSAATQYGLDIAIPDGSITRGRVDNSKPMLMVKVTYLGDGGVAIFSMTNHVAFDGNAMFSFIAHWAKCNRLLGQVVVVELPSELDTYATSLVTNTGKPLAHGPVEISVDATRTPAELSVANSKAVAEGSVQACVFSLSVSNIQRLKAIVEESGVLGEGEWVSSNNVVAAFISQCVARANTESQVYEAGSWTLFQALDMRRALGLPLRGLGSPLILAECQATSREISDTKSFFPVLARRVRQSLDKYSGEYLQAAMDWMNQSYGDLAKSGTVEPWRHFWFSALNTNRRAVGVSCMNRIPIYDADFGAGWPTMARSFNPRPNYVIVFPGPPPPASSRRRRSASGGEEASPPEYEALHLYVTLERPAMEALRADAEWSKMCSLVSEK
ncbi:hypothetical protein GGF38_000819 [Coemansia sp. RSA 25]|nr:hypothetical protein GGF38_000819 [Coemansia sp. RSA 25]